MITIKLELIGSAGNINPSLMEGRGTLHSTIKTWCRKSLELTNLIGVFYAGQKTIFSRVSKGGGNYEIVQKIINVVEGIAKQCTTHKVENIPQYSTVCCKRKSPLLMNLFPQEEIYQNQIKLQDCKFNFHTHLGNLDNNFHIIENLRVNSRQMMRSHDLDL
jgi:hypothetical protein